MLAAESLLRLQLPSGLFHYEIDLSDGSRADMSEIDPFNMARQTGSAYALAEYFRGHPSPKLKVGLEAALAAFVERSLPVGRGSIQEALEWSGLYNSWTVQQNFSEAFDGLGLLYDDDGPGWLVSGDGRYESAWGHPTALALLTEMHYARASGDERFAAARARWLEGLLTLLVEGRGFRGSAHVLFEDAYVNAEGWYALSTYARMFPDDLRVAQRLAALDGYLMERYADWPSKKFYHWGMMASEQRYAVTREARFLDFIAAQSRHYIDVISPIPHEKGLSPCAALEGLTTARRLLKESSHDAALTALLDARIAEDMTFNDGLQILTGQDGVTGAVTEAGAYVMGENEPIVRIDMIAHCISAQLRMVEPVPVVSGS